MLGSLCLVNLSGDLADYFLPALLLPTRRSTFRFISGILLNFFIIASPWEPTEEGGYRHLPLPFPVLRIERFRRRGWG